MQPVQASSSHSVIIQVEHLSHVITTRATKTTILDDLSFLVPERSLFAITGPSGSGKSTLLNIDFIPVDGILRKYQTQERVNERIEIRRGEPERTEVSGYDESDRGGIWPGGARL